MSRHSGGFKRAPDVPEAMAAWYPFVSKADLAEALLLLASTDVAEGCDDLDDFRPHRARAPAPCDTASSC